MDMILDSKSDDLLLKMYMAKSDTLTWKGWLACCTFPKNFDQTTYKIFQHDSQDISRRKGLVTEAVVVLVVDAVVEVVVTELMILILWCRH